MNNLSQECIEQIDKSQPYELPYNRATFKCGAIAALTNPTIYQSANLMTVEEALRFAEWVADKFTWIPLQKKFVHDDDYEAEELQPSTELLTIFRNQNQEK